MKKLVISLVVAATLAAALFSAGTVFAQTTNPPVPGRGFGPGGMGAGRGVQAGPANGSGLLHDAMIAYIAEKLDLTVDELNARLAGGETMAEVAVAEGLTLEEFWALKAEARTAAIDQAVADGTLTAEQAEWMQSRGARMGGRMGGGGMMRGSGFSGCPYYTAPAP